MKKKIIGFMLVLCAVMSLTLCVSAAEIIDSGTCGDNLTWTLDGEGTLTISGTGDMWDYDYHDTSPFYMNGDIKSVIIENGIGNIGDRTFYGCDKLWNITIPESVTSIGCLAFSSCDALANIILPSSITSIGDAAFGSTAYYKNSNNWETGVLYIDEYLIDTKSSSMGAECTIKNTTKVIADGAFEYSSALASVIIPNSVITIGKSAFARCAELTNIEIGNSVTIISDSAFLGCSKLADVTIPNSVKTIGRNAFSGCSSLTSIAISNNVINIGDYAFNGCSDLTKINVDVNNPNYCSQNGVLFNADNTKLIQYPAKKTDSTYTIPDGVKDISGAFCDCTNLVNIAIPKSVKNIDCAFNGCTNLTEVIIPNGISEIVSGTFTDCINLINIEIPNSVTYIGYCAFKNCSSLESVTIPNSVNYIRPCAFVDCKGLYYINFQQPYNESLILCNGIFGGTAYYNDDSNWENGILYLDKLMISTNSDYTFNESYRIKDGTEIISEGVFRGVEELKHLIVPNSVKTICGTAFKYTDNLESIKFEGDMPKIIGVADQASGIIMWPFSRNFEFLDILCLDILYPKSNISWEYSISNFDKYFYDDSGNQCSGYYFGAAFQEYYDTFPIISNVDVFSNGDNMQISVTLADTEYDSEMITAFYKDGVMVDMTTTSVSAGDADKSVPVPADGADTAKVFIWSGLDSMRPLCETETLDLKNAEEQKN